MSDATTPAKRRPGRPAKDPSGATRKVSTWLTPAEIAWLEGRYQSVYAGLRELVRRDAAKKPRAKIS